MKKLILITILLTLTTQAAIEFISIKKVIPIGVTQAFFMKATGLISNNMYTVQSIENPAGTNWTDEYTFTCNDDNTVNGITDMLVLYNTNYPCIFFRIKGL